MPANCYSQAVKTQKPSPPDLEAVQRWRDLRLGMMINWGPVTLRGTEIGWSRGKEVPIEEYDRLYEQFNPVSFDAHQWVAVAKDAGFRYLVFDVKHHDGFCLWPTRQTDYHIGNTPFGRDVTGELATACHAHGLAFGVYYSICDWRHPDYPLDSPGGKRAKPSPDMDRYDASMRAQLAELQRWYGPLLCFWFDGEWEEPWTHARGVALNNWCHQLQPGLLVNNRVGKGRPGRPGVIDPSIPVAEHPGDFATPEQEVGEWNRRFPWESCLLLTKEQWSWKPDDSLKSLNECVDLLFQVIGGDGNFLLNVGPMPDGRIEQRQACRLTELGVFVKRHADAIFRTRGGPFQPGPWGTSTCKENKIYLFVRKPCPEAKLVFPAINQRILTAKTITGGPIAVAQTDAAITLGLPGRNDGESVSLVELTVTGRAFDIEPVAESLVLGGRVVT